MALTYANTVFFM